MESYDHNGELVSDVDHMTDEVQTLGYSLGGGRILAAKTGGEKSPAVMTTAGAHSTERAGVVAAVELLEKLNTDHEVYVIPTRDSVGLNGFEYALELALDRNMAVDTYSRARSFLETEGDVVYDGGPLCIALIGDYGFAINPLDDGAE